MSSAEVRPDEEHYGIWLEVAEVRFETRGVGCCSVLLKGDREQPKPVWWPVREKALKESSFETYKAILDEMDKKRVVLARLSCSATGNATLGHRLYCDVFRFQAPELGSR